MSKQKHNQKPKRYSITVTCPVRTYARFWSENTENGELSPNYLKIINSVIFNSKSKVNRDIWELHCGKFSGLKAADTEEFNKLQAQRVACWNNAKSELLDPMVQYLKSLPVTNLNPFPETGNIVFKLSVNGSWVKSFKEQWKEIQLLNIENERYGFLHLLYLYFEKEYNPYPLTDPTFKLKVFYSRPQTRY